MPSWIIFALLSSFFASLVTIFGKVGVSKIDPTLATTVRAVIMALFLVVTSISLNKIPLLPSLNSKALQFIALSGLSGALSWLFYFVALRQGSTTTVASLDRLSVVFVLILSLLLLGEKFTIKTGVGTVLVTAGAVLMTLK